jgi:hypothetical protein
MRTAIAGLMLFVVALWASSAHAGGPRRLFGRADAPQGGEAQAPAVEMPNSAPPKHPGAAAPAGRFNKQAAIGAYGRAVYPKYYWGFHAREFQNVGVPHGDIGILGSGLSRDAW